MFKKLVAIEPINISQATKDSLFKYANKVKLYQDRPKNNEEIISRIGEADAVLVSFTTRIDAQVIEACKNLRYIGMCCSMYSPESTNVDFITANQKGIVVTGVRDYGDEGVTEYVVSELVRLLHGFGGQQWKDMPCELTNQKIGIIGLGVTGLLVSRGLKYFGADMYYYNRTRKKEAEQEGFKFLKMDELLQTVDILCTCLSKNVILLHQKEFELFGNGKILINTSIGPGHDENALKNWLACPDNYFLCDTTMAIGEGYEEIAELSNVLCLDKSCGFSVQSIERLSRKVVQNIEHYLDSASV